MRNCEPWWNQEPAAQPKGCASETFHLQSGAPYFYPTIVFLIGDPVLGKIVFSIMENQEAVDLVSKITVISIGVLIALVVILYLVADWKFRKDLKDKPKK